MLFAGIDSGSATTKVVLLKGSKLVASQVVPTGARPEETARRVYTETLENAGFREDEVKACAATGYGRRLLPFCGLVVTEITACATGVRFLQSELEGVRMVVDVGGQDTKVLALDAEGGVADFGMNDKCAAGTGRFLEVLAARLGLGLEECAAAALRSSRDIQMNSTCAVFAESEVVGLLARGVDPADVAASAHRAVAARIGAMVKRVNPEREGTAAFVGGGARNPALKAALEEVLGLPLMVPSQAQIITALGAALEAARKFEQAGGVG